MYSKTGEQTVFQAYSRNVEMLT